MEQLIGIAVFAGMVWLVWRAFARVPAADRVEVALRVVDAGSTRLLDVRDNPPAVLADPRALAALCAQAHAAPPFVGMAVWVFHRDALAAWPPTDRGAGALAAVLFAGGGSVARGIAVTGGALPPAVARAADALGVHCVDDLHVIDADGRVCSLAGLLAG